jgi:hypothetical protein
LRKDGAYVKKSRINTIAVYISNHKPVALKTVVLFAELQIGLSEKRAREYIDKICEAYGYEIKDNVIKAIKNESS